MNERGSTSRLAPTPMTHRKVEFPDDVCVRPTWVLNRNFSLKEAELRLARVAAVGQGQKRKQWNGLPPLFFLYSEHSDFQAFVAGLSETCGPRVKASAAQGEEAGSDDGEDAGAEAPPTGEGADAAQPPATRSSAARSRMPASLAAPEVLTPTPKKRAARPAISMAFVKQQMKKLATS